MPENGGAAHRITSSKKQDQSGHHQITNATDPMEARLLRMKGNIQNPDDENQRFLEEMMGKYGPGPT